MSELRPIGKRQSIPEMMHSVKTQGWIFESCIEKVIIAASVLWTAFSILKYVISFFL